MRTVKAFTLIELLVVIAIIITLASLLLPALAWVGRKQTDVLTEQRIGNALSGLSQGTVAGVTVASRIQEAAFSRHPNVDMRSPLRWRTLSSVLELLQSDQDGFRLNLSDKTAVSRWKNFDKLMLPPNIASIYDSASSRYLQELRIPLGENIPFATHAPNGKPGDSSTYGIGFLAESAVIGATHFDPQWFAMLYDQDFGIYDPVANSRVKQSSSGDILTLFESAVDHGRGYVWQNIDGKLYPPTIQSGKRTYFFWHYDDPPFAAAVGIKNIRHVRLYSRTSLVGEQPHVTLEVVPDKLRNRDWYYAKWPVLRETSELIGSSTVVYQRAWPMLSSDDYTSYGLAWDKAVPDHTPLLWPSPFGTKIISSETGKQIDQFWKHSPGSPDRSLADFSPLLSLDILKISEVVTSSNDTEYATNRSPKKEWNDAWGNPLLAVYGAYAPARHDLQRNNPQYSDLSTPFANMHWKTKVADMGANVDEFTSSLQGGRDMFMRAYASLIPATQMAWVSIGALGPVRVYVDHDNTVDKAVWSGVSPLTWQLNTPEQDVIFRSAWLQIRQYARAADWTDAACASPPWNGVKRAIDGDVRVFLSGPKAIQ